MVRASKLNDHLIRNGRDVCEHLLLKSRRSKALTLATGELMNSGSAGRAEVPFPVLMTTESVPPILIAHLMLLSISQLALVCYLPSLRTRSCCPIAQQQHST
jgi:hypothetical protein